MMASVNALGGKASDPLKDGDIRLHAPPPILSWLLGSMVFALKSIFRQPGSLGCHPACVNWASVFEEV